MNPATLWRNAHKDEPEFIERQKEASRRYYEKHRELLKAKRMFRYWNKRIEFVETSLDSKLAFESSNHI